MRLAQTSNSPEERLRYANLARTWLTLAGDLQDLEAQQKSARAARHTGACLTNIVRWLEPQSLIRCSEVEGIDRRR